MEKVKNTKKVKKEKSKVKVHRKNVYSYNLGLSSKRT